MLTIPLPSVSLPEAFPGIPTRNETTIVHRFHIGPDHTLTDPDSVTLASPHEAGGYGVRRQDTHEVVVMRGTPMERDSLGVYTYTFTDPAPRLAYEYYVRWEYGGEVHYVQSVILGSLSPDGTLYDLLPQCETMLPGIAEPFLKQQLRLTARDYCYRSHAWRESLPVFITVEDQTDYLLTLPADTSLLHVYDVLMNGVKTKYSINTDTLLTLDYAKGGESVHVGLALFPSPDCVGYPIWFLAAHGSGIVDGVLARCMAMSGKPWFSESWVRHEGLYFEAVNNAKMNLLRKIAPEDVYKKEGVVGIQTPAIWPRDWR